MKIYNELERYNENPQTDETFNKCMRNYNLMRNLICDV